MSHSAFPVELMNEIFRSSELERQDLANCCLLSRRYLQAAQRWLYHSLEVRCCQCTNFLGCDVDDEKGDMWEYSSSSWLLLVTLRSSKSLQNHIRSLEFAIGDYTYFSEVRTSLNSAMLTFFTAAPECQELIMKNKKDPDYDLDHYTEWSASDFSGGLTYTMYPELIMDVLPIYDPRDTLRRSQRITLISTEKDSLDNWSDTTSPSDDPLQLVHFKIFRKSSKLLDFLRRSYDSLRTLQVPVSAFLTLPFAKLTQLTLLTLLFGTHEDRSKKLQLSKSFWTTFGQSPSLRRLTFSGEPTAEEVEILFGSRSDGPGRSRRRSNQAVKSTVLTCKPPSLQRLEFLGSTPFDLINFVLDRPEMVVPEIGLSKKSSAFEKETLRSMFERSPVELIWLERKAWDVCSLLLCCAEYCATTDAFNFDRIKSDDSESRSFTSIQYPCDSSQSSISS